MYIQNQPYFSLDFMRSRNKKGRELPQSTGNRKSECYGSHLIHIATMIGVIAYDPGPHNLSPNSNSNQKKWNNYYKLLFRTGYHDPAPQCNAYPSVLQTPQRRLTRSRFPSIFRSPITKKSTMHFYSEAGMQEKKSHHVGAVVLQPPQHLFTQSDFPSPIRSPTNHPFICHSN